jgi:hypothetical protein
MEIFSITGRKPKDPNQQGQDVVIVDSESLKSFVVLCDGHGLEGRGFAETVAACCAELTSQIVEISEESCAQLCGAFHVMVCENFENWGKEFPNSGTTVLIVVFSPDRQTYMVIKLGDSYVLQIPEGFKGNGHPLAFDSVILDKRDPHDEDQWGTSKCPWELWRKHLKEQGRGINGVKAFRSHYGANVGMLGHSFSRDNVRLSTMGIEPTLVKPDDDIRRVLESFTVNGVIQRKPGHRLIIASDGLPIEDPDIWGMLSSKEALEAYFAEKPAHDDVTVVVDF